MKVEVDVEKISKLKAKDKDINAKNLVKKFDTLIKDYIIDAATDKHFVVIDDNKEEEFNKILEEITKLV